MEDTRFNNIHSGAGRILAEGGHPHEDWKEKVVGEVRDVAQHRGEFIYTCEGSR